MPTPDGAFNEVRKVVVTLTILLASIVYRATVGAGVLGVGGGNERRQMPGTSKEHPRNMLGTCLLLRHY
jgi:hypothetical protein